MFSFLTGKVALYVVAALLGVIMLMGINTWWQGTRLDKAKADFAEAKAAYILVAGKLAEQNTAINALGDRKKEADIRAEEARKLADKTKIELNKAKAKIKDHKPDPAKTPCANAMDLISEAKK